MQTSHIWNKLDLRWTKVIFLIVIVIGIVTRGNAQGMFGLTSAAGSDDKLISYGFFLASHTSTYQTKYSGLFLDPGNTANNKIHSIYSKFTPGFSLGFMGIFRLHDQVNLMFTPKIAFYEYRVDVNYFTSIPNNTGTTNPVDILSYQTDELINEATIVGLPLLFKYRSQRFNNTRMYFIGGGSYEFRTKSQDEANLDPIVTTGKDYTIEAGIGFELYFKFFKFAPEIRFSHGLNNLYLPEKNDPKLKDALASVKRKGITIYLNFQ